MKTKNIIALLLMFMCLACSEDLLDVKNEKSYDANTYFASAETYKEAVTAMYTPLLHSGMYSRDAYFIFDLLGNDAEKNTPLQGEELQLPNYSFTPTNSKILAVWYACYIMQERTLFALHHLNKWETADPAEVALRERYKGEAKFLKSLSNFWLVTLWGDVPLKKDAFNDPVHMPRTAASEVWATIESDLTEAIDLLPVAYGGDDLGRATKGAAIALLGKAFLYQKKYDQAIVQFEKLTQAPFDYTVEGQDYDDIFLFDNAASKDVIFAVMHGEWQGWGVGHAYYMFGGTETWGNVATHSGRAMEYGFNDWYNVYVSNALVASFKYKDEANNDYIDPRAAKVFYGTAANGGDTDFCNTCAGGAKPFNKTLNSWRKYELYESQEVLGIPQSKINSQLIRYADVLLMLAECYIEKGQLTDALPLINAVRRRSGAFEFTTLGDKDNATTILRRERRMELAGEQIRYFDLVRWGILVDTINDEKQPIYGSRPVQAYNVLFPIPQQEVDSNPVLKAQVKNGWN